MRSFQFCPDFSRPEKLFFIFLFKTFECKNRGYIFKIHGLSLLLLPQLQSCYKSRDTMGSTMTVSLLLKEVAMRISIVFGDGQIARGLWMCPISSYS